MSVVTRARWLMPRQRGASSWSPCSAGGCGVDSVVMAPWYDQRIPPSAGVAGNMGGPDMGACQGGYKARGEGRQALVRRPDRGGVNALNTRAVTEKQSRDVAEAARQKEWHRPSFAKELFLGRFQLDLVHPHPRPTAEARAKGDAFLARLEAFLRAEVDPEVIERDAKIPDSVVKGLCDLGALGMKIEEEDGGLGLTNVYYNRALAMAGTCHSALSTLLSAHQSIGVPQPLKLFGTPEQKRKYLPRVARNEISAFLLTEPDVGSDPARMQCTAVPTEDGSAYLINGEKLWTTNGVIADLLVVMANVPRSDGHRGGITAFIVDAHAPGVKVLHRNQFMGLRGIENGVTRFENVRVPADDVGGGEVRGFEVVPETL